MTIELLVMRHAKSDWNTNDTDFDRPLNGRGVRAADRMAEWIEENDLVPDRIISSPAERARATAMAVVWGCGVDRAFVDFDRDLYHADAFTWLQLLTSQTTSRRLLICGHNPGLDDLVDHLAATPPPLSSSGKLMTTAAIAHFRFDCPWSDITAGSGHLVKLTRRGG